MMYKNNYFANEAPGNGLAAAITQEFEAQFSAVIPSIEAIVQRAVSSAIAPLLENGNQVPEGKMTRAQFCERYSVSLATYYNLRDSGILHPLKIGSRVLLDVEEVESKLASGELGRYKHRNK